MPFALDLHQPRRLNPDQPSDALYITSELPDAQMAQGMVGTSDREIKMKLSIVLSTLLVAGVMAASVEPASAIIYCSYVGYPVGCTVRAGVVLRPHPRRARRGDARNANESRRSGGPRRSALTGVGKVSASRIARR